MLINERNGNHLSAETMRAANKLDSLVIFQSMELYLPSSSLVVEFHCV